MLSLAGQRLTQPVWGFVLVGGQSRRMGQNKAFLEFEGKTLLERMVEILEPLCDEVFLVGPRSLLNRINLALIEDVFPQKGPLAGIHAALVNSKTDLNIVLPCDMPGLEPAFLAELLAAARDTTVDVVVAVRADGRPVAVCGVYKKRCLPVIEKSLVEDRLALHQVLSQLRVAYVRPNSDAQLFNINTPEDWAQWNERLACRSSRDAASNSP